MSQFSLSQSLSSVSVILSQFSLSISLVGRSPRVLFSDSDSDDDDAPQKHDLENHASYFIGSLQTAGCIQGTSKRLAESHSGEGYGEEAGKATSDGLGATGHAIGTS
ncbi:hypothetical protein ACFE04_030158 [Oxalis oulophora]